MGSACANAVTAAVPCHRAATSHVHGSMALRASGSFSIGVISLLRVSRDVKKHGRTSSCPCLVLLQHMQPTQSNQSHSCMQTASLAPRWIHGRTFVSLHHRHPPQQGWASLARAVPDAAAEALPVSTPASRRRRSTRSSTSDSNGSQATVAAQHRSHSAASVDSGNDTQTAGLVTSRASRAQSGAPSPAPPAAGGTATVTLMIVESPAKAHKIQSFLGPDYEVKKRLGTTEWTTAKPTHLLPCDIHAVSMLIAAHSCCRCCFFWLQVIASYGHVRDLDKRSGAVYTGEGVN